MRLGTFNLFSGRSPGDGRTEAERLREAAARLDADVLALQEVDRRQPRSSRADQTALVAQALAAGQAHFLPTMTGVPYSWVPDRSVPAWAGTLPGGTVSGDTAPGGDPEYGIALVSRLPVISWHVLRLRRGRGRYPLIWTRRPPFVHWITDEPRAAVAAVLAEPQLTVACTHLSFVPVINALQVRQVTRWLATLPAPRVLLGDLNLPGRLPARLTGWTPLNSAAPTFPAPAPRTEIDHVLADRLPPGSSWRSQVVEQLPVSDHRALLVDLRLEG